MVKRFFSDNRERLPGFIGGLVIGLVLIAAGISIRGGQTRGVEAAVAGTATASVPDTPTPTPSFTPTPSDTPTPTLTPTLTPTGTLPPTNTPLPTDTPSPTPVPASIARLAEEGYPTPEVAPSTPIPTPVEPIEVPSGVINIMLLGSDLRQGDPGFRTDTIIIVSVNTKENTVNMLSLPRDLFVYVPGWSMRRINTAFGRGEAVGWQGGGAGLLKETLLYNFGIRVDYYALVDLRGFQDIVDTLDGVEVPVDCALEGWVLKEPRLKPEDFASYAEWVDYTDPDDHPENYVRYTLPVGVHDLDGYMALWYARQRIGSSDFDRAYRQQQVLKSIFRKARDLGLIDIQLLPDFWRQYNDLVQTDMGLGNLFLFAPIAANVNDIAINTYVLTPDLLTAFYDTELSQQVFLPNPGAVEDLVSLAMQPPAQNYVINNSASVEVRNGTGVTRLDEVAADAIINRGMAATATGFADRQTYEKTVIYDFTGREKTSQLRTLQRLLRVGEAEIIVQPDPNRAVDYLVVLGENYRSCTRTINVPVAPTPGPTPDGTPGTPDPSIPTPGGDVIPTAPPAEATPEG